MCDAAEYVVPCEWTLARIVQDAIGRGLLPERFVAHGNITIGGEIISREYWPAVRARNGAPIHMWIPPMDPLSIGSAIGSLLFSAGASVGLVNAAIVATTYLVPAIVGIAGQLAVNALFRPPQSALNDSRDSVANANRAAISQNIPQKGQSYPFCFGTARVAPQPICYARTYLSGDNVYAEAVLALAGPHSMSDIRVGGVPIVDDDAIETWVDDGTASSRINQFSEYAYTAQISAELAAQDIRVGEDTFTDQELRDQVTPANSLPPWVRCASRRNADRLELRLLIRNPFDAGAGLANQIIWFRLRARQIGTSTWKNIGTLPYRANGQGDFRRQIAFHFARYPGGVSDVKKEPNGFIIPSAQPAVTVDHAVIKIADGERFPAAYAFTYKRDSEGIDIWPNDDAGEAYFTTGDEFEFELQRSEMVEQSELGVGDTEIARMETSGGSVFDYFDARLSGGKWLANENTDDQGDQLYLESAVSVFEQPPVPEGANMATLSIRSKNKELNEITVLGSALIPAWNGTIFTGQTATSNPADHYRNINCGSMTVSPLADIYSDDEALGDWADECIANSYEINLAYYGKFGEARDIVASAGYARPLEGLKQSITWYRDTSAELPVQAFTPRNTRNYSWSLAFTRRPGAILAKFLNSAKDFSDDEIVIEDPYDVPGASADIEEVDFPGLTTEAQVTARALFDFQQAHNAVRHRVEVGFEYLTDETRPGKVAILSNDALHSQAAWARIGSVVDGTSFVIDEDVGYSAETSFFDIADVLSAENIFGGEPWGVAVRQAGSGNVKIYPLTGYTADTRTVFVPDSSGLSEGDLCVFGPIELVTRRVIITDVTPSTDDTAEIVCMDESFGWASGTGQMAGWLLDRLAIEPDGMALDFLNAKALVRDATTSGNAFFGDINQLLAYASPSAKYVLSASGVYESGTTLRIDHDADGNPLGLLRESQRTNLLTRSQEFDHANWTKVSATISADATTAPDGTTTADTITANASTNFVRAIQVATLTAATHDFSIWAKAGTTNYLHGTIEVVSVVTMRFSADLASGTVNIFADTGYSATASIEAWADGWHRIKILFTATAAATTVFVGPANAYNAVAATSGNSVHVWGAQLEAGGFASSYIATAGSQVTRAADDISLALSALPFSATAGMLAVEATPLALAGEICALSDGTADERIALGAGAASHLAVTDGGVTQADIDAGTFAAGTAGKLAAAWTASDFAASLDGATAVADASGTLPTVDTLTLGEGFDGHLKSLTYLPRRVTDAQLEALAA